MRDYTTDSFEFLALYLKTKAAVEKPPHLKIPRWINPTYVIKCLALLQLQRQWKPAAGDWFYCREPYLVNRIDTLENYYPEDGVYCGKLCLEKILHQGMPCDIYLPNPRTLRRHLS